jgi:hypothetical protein
MFKKVNSAIYGGMFILKKRTKWYIGMVVGVVFLFISGFMSTAFVYKTPHYLEGAEKNIFKGSGTIDDPFLIYDVFELQDMNLDLTAHYQLAADIDASETSTWNNGLGFMPIGRWSTQSFQGSFYGNNYTISNLYINRANEEMVGLFGYVGHSAVISYVGLINADVSSGKYQCVGTLVGRNQGLVTHCYATGSVYGGYRVGGLVGENNPGTVSFSHAAVSVSAFENRIGGLVGFNWNGFITDSYATGNVSGVIYVGGLTGRNLDGDVYDSYATGNVYGSSCVGGLTGNGENSIITSCYSVGDVTGGWSVGGLVGYCWSVTISNSYAQGAVNGNTEVGGFVGYLFGSSISTSYSTGEVVGTSSVGGFIGTKAAGGIVTHSFWDVESSGMQTSDGGIGKTTSEMQDIVLYETAGWDISLLEDFVDETWYINQDIDYPRLGWQNTSFEPVAILSCTGSISWVNVTIGSFVTAEFFIQNSGDLDSFLSWKIFSYPDWGVWVFTPSSGSELSPQDGIVTVEVEVVAPLEKQTEFTGEIIVVNSDDTQNFCRIDVALVTPLVSQSHSLSILQRLVQRFKILS